MKEYTVSEDYLDRIMKKWSRVLVGHIMKRFEIFESKKAIKASVKELVYENTRTLKELIESFDLGVNFITKPNGQKDSV